MTRPLETLTLNGVAYRLEALLGRGAVVEAYRASVPGIAEPVVLRLLRSDHSARSLEAGALRNEAAILERLNRLEVPTWAGGSVHERAALARATLHQRGIVALLDSGHDQRERPFTVQEFAPAAFVARPLADIADEPRAVEVALALAEVMALCHSHNIAFKDFDTAHDKTNRVRVAWNDQQRLEHLKVIDWNVVGGSDDLTADVRFFGAFVYYALFRDRLPAGTPLPEPQAQRLSVGSRLILQRLLLPDPATAYATIHEALADLRWWHGLLFTEDPSLLEKAIATSETLDRRLAIADLGRRRFSQTDAGARLDRAAAQAEVRVGARRLLRLDRGLILLRAGRFASAVEEFRRIEGEPDLDDEVLRRARLYRRLASALVVAEDSPSARGLLNQAAELIRQGHWREINAPIEQALAQLGPQADRQPFEELLAPTRVDASAAQLERLAHEVVPPTSLEDLAAFERQSTPLAARIAAAWGELERAAAFVDPSDQEARGRASGAARVGEAARAAIRAYGDAAAAYTDGSAYLADARNATGARRRQRAASAADRLLVAQSGLAPRAPALATLVADLVAEARGLSVEPEPAPAETEPEPTSMNRPRPDSAVQPAQLPRWYVVALAFLAAVAVGALVGCALLLARVAAAERTIAALEQRVAALERKAAAQPRAVAARDARVRHAAPLFSDATADEVLRTLPAGAEIAVCATPVFRRVPVSTDGCRTLAGWLPLRALADAETPAPPGARSEL